MHGVAEAYKGRLTGLKALGSSQPQAGLRITLYCASSSARPAGSRVLSLSCTSLTTIRLRLLAATGCSRIASCAAMSHLRTDQAGSFTVQANTAAEPQSIHDQAALFHALPLASAALHSQLIPVMHGLGMPKGVR